MLNLKLQILTCQSVFVCSHNEGILSICYRPIHYCSFFRKVYSIGLYLIVICQFTCVSPHLLLAVLFDFLCVVLFSVSLCSNFFSLFPSSCYCCIIIYLFCIFFYRSRCTKDEYNCLKQSSEQYAGIVSIWSFPIQHGELRFGPLSDCGLVQRGCAQDRMPRWLVPRSTLLTSCQHCVNSECIDTNFTIDVDVTRTILNNSMIYSVRVSSAFHARMSPVFSTLQCDIRAAMLRFSDH